MSNLEETIRHIMAGKNPPERAESVSEEVKKSGKMALLEKNNKVIYDQLNDRQKTLAEHLKAVVDEHGKFDKSAKSKGAHYVEDNPFAKQGIKCTNCLFYDDAGGCSLVSGDIDDQAICKFWIIPDKVIKG